MPMPKPGDIIFWGDFPRKAEDLCLVFTSRNDEGKEDYKNVLLSCCKEGGLEGSSMKDCTILTNIEELDLAEVIFNVLKDKANK